MPINALIQSAAVPTGGGILPGIAGGMQMAGGLQRLQAAKLELEELHDRRRRADEYRRIMGSVTDPQERIDMLYSLGDVEGATELQRLYLSEQKLGMEREQMERAQTQFDSRNAFLGTLPPDQQAFGRAFPEEFGKQYGAALFPESADVNWHTERVIIDGQPALVQIHPRTGEVRPMPGINPLTSGLKVEVGPDGSVRLAQGEGVSGGDIEDVGGRLPPGFRYRNPADPRQGAEPIPGGPADIEMRESRNKNAMRLLDLERQWSLVDDTISQALEDIGRTTAGFTGALINAVPGSPAYDLSQTLQTIRANIGFDKLQAMRENSPTGGALGQVSNLENQLLQSVQGSLEQAQSPTQLRENLGRIQRDLRALKADRLRAFEQTYGTSLDSVYGGQPNALLDTPATRDAPATLDAGNDGPYLREDLEFTARKRGITVEEVKRLLGVP